jgi:hypothetical protein
MVNLTIHTCCLFKYLNRNNLIKSHWYYNYFFYRWLIYRDVKMKTQLIIVLILNCILCSCGTVSGTLNGTGSVLEGIASDARQLGNIFKY